MHRNRLSVAAMLAMATIGATPTGATYVPPRAQDDKPERRQRAISGGNHIPFEHLRNTRVETVGAPGSNLGREERRARRKVRMRLRKLRGWR